MELLKVITDRDHLLKIKSFEKGREEYLKNFKKLESEKLEDLRKELRRIKEEAIKNLKELKEDAIKNLKRNGVKVFEASNSKEAIKILKEIIPEGELIVKSKTNVGREIGLKEEFKGRNEIIETDCGDFLVSICEKTPSHPVTPAIGLSLDEIVKSIKEKFGSRVEKSPKAIVEWVKSYLKEKILSSKIGLTGANAISSDGYIFIVENEGNISLVSRIPEKHIILTSIDKIVKTSEEAMTICKALSFWGTGASSLSYINVIGGPSKTADVQKCLVHGVHGANEVYLIMLDNGRSKLIEDGFEEVLYCINCGACLYYCPIFRILLEKYGGSTYFGGIGLLKSLGFTNLNKLFESGAFYCTTCSVCKTVCPLGIDIPKYIRKLREVLSNSNLNTESNKFMVENLDTYGSPFGEVTENEKPEKMFCC